LRHASKLGWRERVFAEDTKTAASMTVQVTPLSSDSLGLAVAAKRLDGIVVKELHGGTGNYEFDWEVKSVRKGYEKYQVIRPRGETALPR